MGEIVVLLKSQNVSRDKTFWSTDDVTLTCILGNNCRPFCNSSEIRHCHKKNEKIVSDESCMYRVPVIFFYIYFWLFLIPQTFVIFMLSDLRTIRYKHCPSDVCNHVVRYFSCSFIIYLFWVFCHLIFLEEILRKIEAQYRQCEAICPLITHSLN